MAWAVGEGLPALLWVPCLGFCILLCLKKEVSQEGIFNLSFLPQVHI